MTEDKVTTIPHLSCGAEPYRISAVSDGFYLLLAMLMDFKRALCLAHLIASLVAGGNPSFGRSHLQSREHAILMSIIIIGKIGRSGVDEAPKDYEECENPSPMGYPRLLQAE